MLPHTLFNLHQDRRDIIPYLGCTRSINNDQDLRDLIGNHPERLNPSYILGSNQSLCKDKMRTCYPLTTTLKPMGRPNRMTKHRRTRNRRLDLVRVRLLQANFQDHMPLPRNVDV